MNYPRKLIKLDGYKKIFEYKYGQKVNEECYYIIPSGLYTQALKLVKDNELKNEEFMQNIFSNHQKSMKELNAMIKPVQNDQVTSKMQADKLGVLEKKLDELRNLILELKK